MAFDPSKLSPAPWLMDGDGGIFGPHPDPPRECSRAVDLEFCCLARNAFDVMMRRGWTARKMAPQEGWLVQDNRNAPLLQPHMQSGRLDWFTAADPFTALVEADQWYRVNVEAKEG